MAWNSMSKKSLRGKDVSGSGGCAGGACIMMGGNKAIHDKTVENAPPIAEAKPVTEALPIAEAKVIRSS